MMKKRSTIFTSPLSFIFVMTFLSILAYGLYLAWMGFYWDDWPWIWFSHVMGSAGMLKIDLAHRPISGLVLWLGSLLAGENSLGWQIYNLAWRWLTGLALWTALRQLWPRRGEAAAWVTLLFLVYPGFSHQFVAVNTSRHLFPLATFFFSLACMIRAQREPERCRFFTAASVILALVTMFTTEYYYGLELIRPAVLWLALYDSDRTKTGTELGQNEYISPFLRILRGSKTEKSEHKRKSRSLLGVTKAWLPYLMPLIVVFLWRYLTSLYVNYPVRIAETISTAPTQTLGRLILTILRDFVDVTLGTWAHLICAMPMESLGFRTTQYYWILVTAGTLMALVWFILQGEEVSADGTWNHQALGLGAAMLLVGGIPFWITQLDIRTSFPADRLTLPMMAGASMILVSLVRIVSRKRSFRLVFLALLVGLSVGVHFQNALAYRNSWGYQRQFFQQLAWRIPALQDDTALLTTEIHEISHATDNSLSAPLIWTYAPDFESGDLPLFLFYTDLRFKDEIDQLQPDTLLQEQYRFFPFASTPSQSLVIYYQPPSCLRIMEQDRHQYLPGLPDEIKEVLQFSDPTRILVDVASEPQLPPMVVDPNLNETWCHYFQLADLARQRSDWQGAAAHADRALEVGFPDSASKHVSEYVLFTEAYAHTGRWARAEDLTFQAVEIDPQIVPMVCEAWERVEAEVEPLEEGAAVLENVNRELNCSAY
jgi:hypothetical protein